MSYSGFISTPLYSLPSLRLTLCVVEMLKYIGFFNISTFNNLPSFCLFVSFQSLRPFSSSTSWQ